MRAKRPRFADQSASFQVRVLLAILFAEATLRMQPSGADLFQLCGAVGRRHIFDQEDGSAGW